MRTRPPDNLKANPSSWLHRYSAIERARRSLVALLVLTGFLCRGADPVAAKLPSGVEAVWDINKAYHETTPTRERICLNGLWEWQPAEPEAKEVPVNNWGYFKVPGPWPGITDYMQKDCQTLYANQAWSNQNLAEVSAAWYQRELTIPHGWTGRRICLSLDYLNSYAVAYLDGKQAGEATFPGGEVQLPATLQPGNKHELALLVIALPLKGVILSYTDSAAAREQRGAVARRGLCGDVYLVSTPKGPRITDIRVETSVRHKELTVSAALADVNPLAPNTLRVRVLDSKGVVKEFTTQSFQTNDLNNGRIAFTQPWLPDKLWDTHTPQNVFNLEVSLLDADRKNLDTAWTVPFGFRELWIDGRDFILNGTRIFLSAVPLDNAQVSAAVSTYSATRESLERLKSIGINFVYTHNYGCEPGAHLAFNEILKAADDVGMLVSFSQPHFSHYDWSAHDADQSNGYARHSAYYVRAAQNHPSVVMYSMSHNATGYEEDMNPDMIDGIQAPRDTWASKNVLLASRAEAIVKRVDPSRIVYHHASGNLGSMHPINFYPNFVPIQELSDWFEHWSTQGIKPVFLCEYGAPFTWDWTMYRGWYKGQREFGSAAVPWEFCLAEWNSQFLGDSAFAISEAEKKNLRWEAKQFHDGKRWHRWDYPVEVGSSRFTERYPVFAMYIKDNWRAFRTWGVSANSPWEFEHFWKLRDGADRNREEFKVDWQNLQRPGFSPDYQDQRYERIDLAYNLSDWEPTAAAQALITNNRPLLAYIGGEQQAFTSKDHIFFPGETVEKQGILINDSRETVSAGCQWSFRGPGSSGGSNHIQVRPGGQERVPMGFELPSTTRPGTYELNLVVKFTNGEIQSDRFELEVVSRPAPLALSKQVALFDPKGETKSLLTDLGVRFESVDAQADLSRYDLLVVGKAAVTLDGAAPDIGKVRDGLKVIVFEQTSEVLEKRFGFRVEEYGLRRVFPRIPDHPALAGLSASELRDWRGEATIVPPRLSYEVRPRYGPTIQWCGIPVPHLWRCGNRGNVASVLIEKPVEGDFLPILDGGFSLQYSPVLEYRAGKGMVLFCQMDITGRTEKEPAAEILARNLLRYVSAWTPPTRRSVLYVGEPKGKHHLESVGITAGVYSPARLTATEILVVGPGGPEMLTGESATVAEWLKSGGEMLAIGLGEDKLASLLPAPVGTKTAEHISCFFEPFRPNSLFAGIGPADLHNREPREFPLISSGAEIVGDGVLAQNQGGHVVFCQVAPWQFSDKQPNTKRTHRRASFLLSRLLANMGAESSTPLLDWFSHPQSSASAQDRCRAGLYIDQPEEWDDPYRHFRW